MVAIKLPNDTQNHRIQKGRQQIKKKKKNHIFDPCIDVTDTFIRSND